MFKEAAVTIPVQPNQIAQFPAEFLHIIRNISKMNLVLTPVFREFGKATF